MCGLIHQPLASPAEIVFERTSPYHHIRVIDRKGTRTLSFNGSTETQMSLANPLQGHFEYTEYFQMPRLWNGLLTNVLMIGLGGGSTQRAYAHYFPHMKVETVEIDPFVVQVAKDFFQFKESPRQRVQVSDGRLHLRRTEARFGAILVDAYVQHRYGSSIPYHLATKEFFELAASRLTTNGVLGYNVIGTMDGWRSELVGALYNTMKTAFPQVYFFPAKESDNVVLIGTKSAERTDFNALNLRANGLIHARLITLPTFRERLYSFRAQPPTHYHRRPVLSDDFAPIDGLLRTD